MGWFGPLPFGAKAKRAVVAQNVDARLEVFFIGTDSKLFHCWQIEPNSIFWSTPTPFVAGEATDLAVGRNIDGRLELFYIGTNGHLYHNWQTAPAELAFPETVDSWAGETSFVKIKASALAVGQNDDGRLEVFYADSGGGLCHVWQILPANIGDFVPKLNAWSPETKFPGNKAKQIAVSLNTDGRFELVYVGANDHLYHNWQTQVPDFHNQASINSWAGEVRFGNSSAKFVTVGANSDGRLEVCYTGTGDRLYHLWQTVVPQVNTPTTWDQWSGETRFFKDSGKQIATALNGAEELLLFYVGTDGKLFRNEQTAPSTVQQPNSWVEAGGMTRGEIKEVMAAQDAAGKVELVWIAGDGGVFHLPERTMDQSILGSIFNENVSSNCANLTGVFVTIDITQDLVCPYGTAGSGYGFQLNAFSPHGFECIWQQYTIAISGTKVEASIDNWSTQGQVLNDFFTLTHLSDQKFLAGMQLQIALDTDGTGNVVKATFSLFGPDAELIATAERNLLQLLKGKIAKVAPIVAMGVELVGYDNSACALLSSGAGRITYQANQELSASKSFAPCVASPGSHTEEIANSIYGTLPERPDFVLTQTFGVALTTPRLA